MQPRPFRLLARCGAAATAASLAAIGFTPAHADEASIGFEEHQGSPMILQQDGPAEEVRSYFDVPEGGAFDNGVMTVDSSALTGFAAIEIRNGGDRCSGDGAVLECSLGTLTLDDSGQYQGPNPEIMVSPLPGATGAGVLRLTVSADGAGSDELDVPVRVAEPVQLELGEVKTVEAEPGQIADMPFSVTNVGSNPVYNPSLQLQLQGAHLAAPTPENCRVELPDESTFFSHATCDFPAVLEPGETYRLAEPLQVELREDAPAPFGLDSIVRWHGSADLLHVGGEPGDGPASGLEDESGRAPAVAPSDAPVQSYFSELHPDVHNHEYFFLDTVGENVIDQVAEDAFLPEQRGEAELTVEVRNDGPATLPGESRSAAPVSNTLVELPAGVTAIEAPKQCWDLEAFVPDTEPGTAYSCANGEPFWVGQTQTFTFVVDVEEVASNAEGRIIVGGMPRGANDGEPNDRFDSDLDNNYATITFGEPDGSLPVTGSRTVVYGGAGLALLLAGGVLVMLLRKRKHAAVYGE